MAKGPFILHGASKKIGNMVVYKNPNSNNADTTVAREYVAEVKNPKTRQQAIQRMRMLPAQQFYRAFREILDHSWQGIKYGGRSYAHFMKAALADKTITIPYLLKGTTGFVPGAYPVSQGSLADIRVSGPISKNVNIPSTLMGGDLELNANTTIGGLSTAIIDENSGFEDGDVITVLTVSTDGKKFYAGYARLTLNTTSSDKVQDTDFPIVKGGEQEFFSFSSANTSFDVCAIAFIHSRKPANGSTVWQRSSAFLEIDASTISEYISQQAEEAAIASYQSNAGNVNAHWYLNGGAQ